MRDAVICEPLRTAVGSFGGGLRSVSAATLAATVVRAVVDRSGLEPDRVEDVILGNGYASGEAPAIGRVAALDAGLPVTVPGLQIDRRCGSGLQGVCDAAARIQSGAQDLVIAGGAESMSQVEFYTNEIRWGTRGGVALKDRLEQARVRAGGALHLIPGGMIETAENLRREFAVTREEQDELALESHRRAVGAQERGAFDAEIVPVMVSDRRGTQGFSVDEHPRADATMESLAGLRPIMAKIDSSATVTAGNASGQNDGASACIVTTPELAEHLGLRPMARLVSWAVVGLEPERMGLGPAESSTRALGKAGLSMNEMDLIELNEAFAVQVIASCRLLGIDPFADERLNPNGSGISLGHPIGATGGRILATMLHELHRRAGRYALETMCIGGGQGIAAVFERVG